VTAHAASTRQQVWERVAEWPLMAAAGIFLAAYAIPILAPHAPPAVIDGCRGLAWLTWALFAVDYLARLVLAQDRRRFVTRNWLDFLIIALPLLRPLRLLRLAALLKMLNRKASSSLRGKLVVYVAGSTALLAFCGALAVLDAERASPDANIITFGDAAWWAATTMTTVGYGDRYPVTATGRLAAVALMVGGIAVLGVVTATIASWLVEQVAAGEAQQTDELRMEIVELQQQLQDIEDNIRPDSG